MEVSSKQQPPVASTRTKPANKTNATAAVSKAVVDNATRSSHVRTNEGLSSGVSMATSVLGPIVSTTNRPLSAGSRNHQVAIRKQALVKAVPRTDLSSHHDLVSTSDKVRPIILA